MRLPPLHTEPWWIYEHGREPWFDVPYHAFNLFEGMAWFVVAGLVLLHYGRRRRSRWELVYALAFVAFAVTDFREAYAIGLPLVIAKLAILAGLIRLRPLILRRYYPESRTF